MNFKLNEAVELLGRTPKALEGLLLGVSDEWLYCNEGEGSWNVFEIITHLIEAERNNWIPRLEHMISDEEQRTLPPFDRFSHLLLNEHGTMDEKLLAFKSIRAQSIGRLVKLTERESVWEKTGIHPEFGEVNVSQLISTWVVHDLTHMAQIVRVLAKRYDADVGPWKEYLSILHR
ncbi:DinB family protein [Paenibacillus xylaniclasticus]|uniref:DinB family protein n=1 Tax=Paenibacillus xylaniclasticus TaxID=588083 RepID=UPI000FD7A3C7|nr:MULTISPECIES: DinB family protein [Paenibacillus]GFN33908.1 hypothetical protein PCURB6_41680 [Paenibacillus curdlanolyticus]